MSSLPGTFTFSQSSLQDWSDCARRFQLRYIERLDWPAEESEPALDTERRQAQGELFHRLVQQRFLGVPLDLLSATAAPADVARWWRNFVGEFRSEGGHFPELVLSASLAGHRLAAKYDLISIEGDHAVIYDWKTYAKRPRDEWMLARWQTRVYRCLLVLAGARLNQGKPFAAEQVEMVYWFTEFPAQPARFRYDEGQYRRDRSVLEKVLIEISAATNFPLTEDVTRCRYCTYRSYCNRGARAGELPEGEEGTAAEVRFDINFEQVGEIDF